MHFFYLFSSSIILFFKQLQSELLLQYDETNNHRQKPEGEENGYIPMACRQISLRWKYNKSKYLTILIFRSKKQKRTLKTMNLSSVGFVRISLPSSAIRKCAFSRYCIDLHGKRNAIFWKYISIGGTVPVFFGLIFNTLMNWDPTREDRIFTWIIVNSASRKVHLFCVFQASGGEQ